MGYLQHLVFSLHLHSYFMLFWLTFSGWAMIARFFSSALASWLSFASVIYMVVYAYLALRNVFGQRRRGTLLRGALLLGTYGLVLLTGIIGTLIVALIMV
jgi:succinate dehydrogenase hydrophobic anchor subunit